MANRDITNHEVLDLAVQFKDEMKKVAGDYKTAMATLDKAVKKVEASERKVWVVYKKPIAIGVTLLTLFIFVMGILWTMKATDTCVVTVSQKTPAFTAKSCQDIQ